MPFSQALADRVRGMLANQSSLTEREMFGGIAFLLGGKMAIGVHGDDLIARVDPLQTDALLNELGAKPFDLSGNRAPAGWIVVTPAGFRTDSALRTWVARGVAYASSLPKKAAKSKASRN